MTACFWFNIDENITAAVKSVTGGLGRAPEIFKGTNKLPLFEQVRQEITEHGEVQTKDLARRLQCFAALEFYCGRFLPMDICPYLRTMVLYEFGTADFNGHKNRSKEWGDFDPARHDVVYKQPALENLAEYTGLEEVTVAFSPIDSLTWLESLSGIKKLNISGIKATDFSALSCVTKLKKLYMGQARLSDLAPLLALKELEVLNLIGVQIEDVSPLASLTVLKELTLSQMPITDISDLRSLKKLEKLVLQYVDLSDYNVLAEFPRLTWLDLGRTSIEDLSVLPIMPQLEALLLFESVNVHDLWPLKSFPNQKIVNAKGTAVIDWAAVAHVKTVHR